jgi:hypothetical protein
VVQKIWKALERIGREPMRNSFGKNGGASLKVEAESKMQTSARYPTLPSVVGSTDVPP